ncbi:MAG: (2Fe-2S)-binding protein [Spirochaetales bacterium]|nr:(2Fe-2S)-binding protein [Spirochaetales bacterium]
MRPERICICRGVSRQDIRRAVQEGITDFDALQERTGCSTGCGTCESRCRACLTALVLEEQGKACL